VVSFFLLLKPHFSWNDDDHNVSQLIKELLGWVETTKQLGF